MEELELARRVVIVVAHPDDETIGAGGLIGHLRDLTIIHTTDGAPRDPADAIRSGFSTREEYAAARRRELECAMELAELSPARLLRLNFVDQETMLHLGQLTDRLAREFARLQPDAVLTQPYEGGHPDHDSTAFAVHRSFKHPERLFEMTAYHAKNGALETDVFLSSGNPPTVREYGAGDLAKKQAMLRCFRSQSSVLRDFPVVPEQFRRAPRYDFAQPPHEGVLHYERLPWGITGKRWRDLAAACE